MELAKNMNVSIEEAGKIFMMRSVASVVGTLVGSAYLEYEPLYSTIDPLTTQGLFGLLAGVSCIFMPLVRNIKLGMVVFFIASIPHGFLNVVMQALLIQMWGVEKSKWLVCAYHFLASFGQMLGPSFAYLFLGEQNDQSRPYEGLGGTNEGLIDPGAAGVEK